MFHKRLKELREERNLTQEQLANELHLTPSNISKYENCKLEPNLEQINKISEYFDVSTDYLLGKTYNKESKCSEPDTGLIKKVIDTLSYNNYGHFLVSTKEQEIIKKLRQLNPQSLDNIVAMIDLKIYELSIKKNRYKEEA